MKALMQMDFKKINMILWGATALLLILYIALSHGHHSIFPYYVDAATDWANNIDLYQGEITSFFYLPQAAILLIPLSILPKIMGEVLWCAMSVLLYAYGLKKWVSLSGYKSSALFFIVSLFSLPLVVMNGLHGHLALMAGAMFLLSVAHTGRSRWWLAAVFLILGVILQPMMGVLVLLMMFFYRALWWRILLLLVIAALLPLAIQPVSYAMTQYRDCFALLKTPRGFGWGELAWLLQAFFIGLTFFVSLRAKHQLTARGFAAFLYAASAMCFVLSYPLVRSFDYIFIAPVLGYLFAVYLFVNKRIFPALWAGGILIVMLLHPWLVFMLIAGFYLFFLCDFIETKAKNFDTIW